MDLENLIGLLVPCFQRTITSWIIWVIGPNFFHWFETSHDEARVVVGLLGYNPPFNVNVKTGLEMANCYQVCCMTATSCHWSILCPLLTIA